MNGAFFTHINTKHIQSQVVTQKFCKNYVLEELGKKIRGSLLSQCPKCILGTAKIYAT